MYSYVATYIQIQIYSIQCRSIHTVCIYVDIKLIIQSFVYTVRLLDLTEIELPNYLVSESCIKHFIGFLE